MASLAPYRDLSLRYKIPLRVLALMLSTAVVLTATLIYRDAVDLRAALLASAEGLGRIIGETLVSPLLHEDVWRSFELIRTPFRTSTQASPEFAADVVVVLDPDARVFVSTDPQRFPVLSAAAQHGADYGAIAARIREDKASVPWSFESPESNHLHMVTPVVSDGMRLGTLVMSYSKSMFLPHYLALGRRAALVTLAGLAVVLPIAWWWAVRLAQPLVSLAGEMERIGERLPEERSVAVYESRDEIGQLGTAFKRMVGELREKQLLERQVMASDRLAALGRLSAGIAHEINNPLGGMLNAISTFKRHARQEPVTAKTLSLLERGLGQIRDTVAALLVEARVESHSLTPQDVDDTHTLLASEAHEKRASFDWENGLEHPVQVPSTQARQILINLLLNAVHAIEPGGRIACSTRAGSGSLRIQVTNDGSHIPEDRLPYLFEPFSGASENGHGLGLWVTYQIVQQLNGGLSVTSIPGETRFTVELPIESPA